MGPMPASSREISAVLVLSIRLDKRHHTIDESLFTERNPKMIESVSVTSIPRLRLMLVDDNTDFLDAMELLLEPIGEVVAIVSDARQALETTIRLRPDIVLLDIS